MDLLKKELGERIPVSKLAEYLDVAPATVNRYYRELGGIRLGPKTIVFFERSIINALSVTKQEKEVDGPSPERGGRLQEKKLSDEKGSNRMGGEPKTRHRHKEDLHDLLTVGD